MDMNGQFAVGKHKGRTFNWVYNNDFKYYIWVRENAPGMLNVKNTETYNKNIRKEPLSDEPPSWWVKPGNIEDAF